MKKLTIDQMREIVAGAPERATLCFYFGKTFENRVDYYKHFFNFFQMWLPDHGWFPVHSDLAEDTILLDDLRVAIAEHECYQQELIKGGVVFVGDNSKLVQAIRELDCDHDWEDISTTADLERHLICTCCGLEKSEPLENTQRWADRGEP